MQPQTLPVGGLILLTPSDDLARNNTLALEIWARQVSAAFNTSLAPSASTIARPSADHLALLPDGGIGFSMFDTTLGKPVWWNGAAWVDAAGTVV